MQNTYISRTSEQPPDGTEGNRQETLEPTASSKLNLTIGVEFEFIVAKYPPKDGTNPGKVFGLTLVRNVLSEAREVRCTGCKELYSINLDLNPGMDPDHTLWTVTREDCLGISEQEDEDVMDIEQEFFPSQVEVKSRILDHTRVEIPDGNSGHQHYLGFAEEIETVLNMLTEAFNTAQGCGDGERKHTRIITNSSCGFHVHAGNGRRSFPLKTAKNVASAYTSFEMIIDMMQSADRIDGTKISQTRPSLPSTQDLLKTTSLGRDLYNRPWSSYFLRDSYRYRIEQETGSRDAVGELIYRYPRTHFDDANIKRAALAQDRAKFVQLIQKALDMSSLIRLQNPDGHKCTLNLENLPTVDFTDESEVSQIMTIEFRQFVGTLDPIEVVAWIDFVTALLKYCHSKPDDEFRRTLHHDITTPFYRVEGLLNSLGCDDKTFSHYKSRLLSPEDSSSWAAQAKTRDLAMAHSFSENSLETLRPLLEYFAKRRFEEWNDCWKVKKIMEAKVACGGYGRFSVHEVDAMVRDLNRNDPKEFHETLDLPPPPPSPEGGSDSGPGDDPDRPGGGDGGPPPPPPPGNGSNPAAPGINYSWTSTLCTLTVYVGLQHPYVATVAAAGLGILYLSLPDPIEQAGNAPPLYVDRGTMPEPSARNPGGGPDSRSSRIPNRPIGKPPEYWDDRSGLIEKQSRRPWKPRAAGFHNKNPTDEPQPRDKGKSRAKPDDTPPSPRGLRTSPETNTYDAYFVCRDCRHPRENPK